MPTTQLFATTEPRAVPALPAPGRRCSPARTRLRARADDRDPGPGQNPDPAPIIPGPGT